MEIGVSTASYFGKAVTEKAFDILNDSNIPICETFLTTFSEYEPEFIALLKSRQQSLKVYSVHALTNNFEPQLFNPAERTRQDALLFFDKMLSAAVELGAKVYTFHGLFSAKNSAKVNYERLGKILNFLSNRAEEKGITLAYENVHWTWYNNPNVITNIAEFAPNLHTCLDTKQAMQSGYDYRDYLDKMANRLVNVHLCDYDSNGKLSICGKGEFDFYELFSRLIDSGYDGACLMEVYAEDYKDFSEVTAGYEYLLNIYEKAKKVR